MKPFAKKTIGFKNTTLLQIDFFGGSRRSRAVREEGFVNREVPVGFIPEQGGEVHANH